MLQQTFGPLRARIRDVDFFAQNRPARNIADVQFQEPFYNMIRVSGVGNYISRPIRVIIGQSVFPVKTLPRTYLIALTALLAVAGLHAQTTTTGATFGTIISPSELPRRSCSRRVRGFIYLVNTGANRIDVLSTATNTITTNIPVGLGPLSAAMSMDNNFLYVTNGLGLSP